MDNIEILIHYGLTRMEGTIYLLLLMEGKLNGYEVSKKTSISRSNTYNALAGLVEKGAAYIVEEGSTFYIPVDLGEFIKNKINYLKKLGEEIIKNAPTKKIMDHSYITIKGEKHILDKLTNMLNEVEERIYISLSKNLILEVEDKLKVLIKEGKSLVVISDEEIHIEGCKIYIGKERRNQIRVIVDSKKVLTGDIEDEINSTCLYSTNDNLVQVFKEAMGNEIKLINIGEGK